jgi:hypothetical protein
MSLAIETDSRAKLKAILIEAEFFQVSFDLSLLLFIGSCRRFEDHRTYSLQVSPLIDLLQRRLGELEKQVSGLSSPVHHARSSCLVILRSFRGPHNRRHAAVVQEKDSVKAVAREMKQVSKPTTPHTWPQRTVEQNDARSCTPRACSCATTARFSSHVLLPHLFPVPWPNPAHLTYFVPVSDAAARRRAQQMEFAAPAVTRSAWNVALAPVIRWPARVDALASLLHWLTR